MNRFKYFKKGPFLFLLISLVPFFDQSSWSNDFVELSHDDPRRHPKLDDKVILDLKRNVQWELNLNSLGLMSYWDAEKLCVNKNESGWLYLGGLRGEVRGITKLLNRAINNFLTDNREPSLSFFIYGRRAGIIEIESAHPYPAGSCRLPTEGDLIALPQAILEYTSISTGDTNAWSSVENEDGEHKRYSYSLNSGGYDFMSDLASVRCVCNTSILHD